MKNECQKIISNFDEECNDINFNKELNRFEGTDSIGFSKFIKGECNPCKDANHIMLSTGYFTQCLTFQNTFPKNPWIIPK